jgi:NADPH:quinone reductase-like Zn-dependent oxidoreductase
MVGGDYFPRNVNCLAENGRLIQIGLQNGTKSTINLLPLLLKRITITGSTLRSQSILFKQAIASNLLEKVWPLLADGQISLIIDSTFPLDKAVKAHQRIESSEHIGKIILSI